MKGSGIPGDRHQSDGHGDVDEYVDREQRRHAEGEKGAEAVAGETRNAYAVPQNHAEQAEHRNAPQETFLLGKNRENEICMRLGQVTQLGLRALRPALAGQSP